MIQNIIVAIIAYLLGTFPSALFLVRLTKGTDIRNEGTGNVGAMNSYDITHKKWVGIVVFILDALKGFLAILAAKLIAPGNMLAISLAAVYVLLGHNYNIFLKFKGGRGLSTTAGLSLLVNPIAVVLWGIMWVLGFNIIKKDFHIANIIACICAPLMIYYTPEIIINSTNFVPGASKGYFIILYAILSFIILTRHVKPIIDLYNQYRDKS